MAAVEALIDTLGSIRVMHHVSDLSAPPSLFECKLQYWCSASSGIDSSSRFKPSSWSLGFTGRRLKEILKELVSTCAAVDKLIHMCLIFRASLFLAAPPLIHIIASAKVKKNWPSQNQGLDRLGESQSRPLGTRSLPPKSKAEGINKRKYHTR